MKIIILGAGLIGKPMAIDLAKDKNNQVTVADINEASLKKLKIDHPINTIHKDLSNPENVKLLVKNYDFVINALPGFIGFQSLKAIIEANKNVVDIAFFEEDPYLLDDLAKKTIKTIVIFMTYLTFMMKLLKLIQWPGQRDILQP